MDNQAIKIQAFPDKCKINTYCVEANVAKQQFWVPPRNYHHYRLGKVVTERVTPLQLFVVSPMRHNRVERD